MYAVKMIITDKKSVVFRPYETELTESVFTSTINYDLYVDVFNTREKAMDFYLANLEG